MFTLVAYVPLILLFEQLHLIKNSMLLLGTSIISASYCEQFILNVQVMTRISWSCQNGKKEDYLTRVQIYKYCEYKPIWKWVIFQSHKYYYLY